MDNLGSSIGKHAESVGRMVFAYMKKWRDNIGQVMADTGQTETYGIMLGKTVRTAIKLQSLGFGRGDMISTCSYNHKNSCIPHLASYFIGAIPSSFDPNLPESDTVTLLKLIQPKIMFVSKESLDFIESCLAKATVTSKIVIFGSHCQHMTFDEFLVPSPRESYFTPVEIQNVRDTAVILFSSGTTGNPKGICLSHYTLLHPYFFEGIDEQLSGSQSVYLIYTTLYWISGLIFLLKSITTGAKRVLCARFDPSQFWTITEKYKVEMIFVAPHLAIDCLACKPASSNTSSLKIILTGGSAVTKSYMDDLCLAVPSATILNTYGMTEIGGMACKFDPSKPADVEEQRRKPNSIGRVLNFIKWKVVDPENGKVLGPYEKGEMLLKTDRYMNGYYKLDASNVFDSEGYFKTGDIVYYDEDGCFYVEDRIKAVFKYRGWHIIPSTIEEVIMRHPAVKEAAVVGLSHERDGHHPVAVVVLKDDCLKRDPQELLDFVNKQVSDAQNLRGGLRIMAGELPRTVTGKLKRQTIEEMVKNSVI